MVNPVAPASNFFLGLFQIIPSPIRLLALVAGAFFVITAIINIVRK